MGRAEMHEAVKLALMACRAVPFFLLPLFHVLTDVLLSVALTHRHPPAKTCFFGTLQTKQAARIFSDAEHPTYSGKAVAFLAAGKQ